jgi:hypothetical protein
MAESYHLSRMGGMWTLRPVATVAGFGLLFTLVTTFVTGAWGCSKPANTEGTTAASVNSEEVQPRSSKPSRSEVACRLHSCAPPYFCNDERGVCERLPCVASEDCPYGYKCDFSRNLCE